MEAEMTFEKSPVGNAERRLFEGSRLFKSLYIEYLRLKSLRKEQLEGICAGFLIGSTEMNSKSFVFTTPILKDTVHKYIVLTLEGFRSINFYQLPDGNFRNEWHVNENTFVESLKKFSEEAGKEELRLSTEVQGYLQSPFEENFRTPNPELGGFSGLITTRLQPDVYQEQIDFVIGTLNTTPLDSAL